MIFCIKIISKRSLNNFRSKIGHYETLKTTFVILYCFHLTIENKNQIYSFEIKDLSSDETSFTIPTISRAMSSYWANNLRDKSLKQSIQTIWILNNWKPLLLCFRCDQKKLGRSKNSERTKILTTLFSKSHISCVPLSGIIR